MSSGLDSRPSAVTYELEELVRLAWEGRIRVPHFQRDFRWGKQDVIRLFDSILKGYPIGSLLLWLRPAPGKTIHLGELTISAPDADHALWVVDGQQRITSLANALHEDGIQKSQFALAYDLRNRRVTARRAHNDPWVVPLPVIFDLQKLIVWFTRHPDISEHLDDATAVARKLRQYKVPGYEVRQGDEHVLQDIFDRMNNYGKRLSRAEVFSALYAGDEAGKDNRLTIDLIAQNIHNELNFGLLDNDTVLRAILARRGPDIEREIRLEFSDHTGRRGDVDFPDEDRDAAYEAGEEALCRAVSFLKEHAGVPHVSMLAYRYLLVVLTRFFAHHQRPDQRNLQLLRRWYWRAAVAGPAIFAGSTTGAARTLCSRVRPGEVSRSVQGLLGAIPDNAQKLPIVTRFRTNTASTKILLCSWWSLEPRSPMTGEPYDANTLAECLDEHATAADAVRYIINRRATPTEQERWAANRVLMPAQDEPASETDLLLSRPSFTLDHETWVAILNSHGMTLDMADHLRSEKTAEFFEARQHLLTENLRRFLQRACEWGFEDTPPLDYLVLDDLTEDEDDST